MNRCILAAVLLAAALPLQAETVYRWVDKDGGVHYGATPPPGQPVEQQDLRFQRTPDPAAAAAAQQRMQESIEQGRQAKADAAKAAGDSSKNAAARRERCQEARGIVARLEGARGTRYRQDDGSYRRYTDEEWNAKMTEAQAAQRESCD